MYKAYYLFKSRYIRSIVDVVDWGLCVGCGACDFVCDNNAVRMVSIDDIGIRPVFKKEMCQTCNECLSVCPGFRIGELDHRAKKAKSNIYFGPFLDIWEGFAVDNEIRYKASSGGVITSLAQYCLEKEGMDFTLHTGASADNPFYNQTVLSRTRDDLLSHAGSRYSPSSPCKDLDLVENINKKCVFIGKPCDIAAVRMILKNNSLMRKRIGLLISFFCAGTPNTLATKELISQLNIDTKYINEIHYRGEGWPGKFRVIYEDKTKSECLSYQESWNKLQKRRPFRCHLCPDGLGQFADISCGDAWHKYSCDNNQGSSIIIVRTQRGANILHNAMKAGYIDLTKSDAYKVIIAQSITKKRKVLFGRLLAMLMMQIPIPEYTGFSLFKIWTRNSFDVMVKSIVGTIKRIIKNRLWRKSQINL